jgi:hypothetical protein
VTNSPTFWPRYDRASLASLVAAIAVGVAIRVALAFAADGKSWSDSAVIALMAMHALSGKFYTFYWGQAYMGSLESLGVAPFFALFGVNDVTLSMGLLPWYGRRRFMPVYEPWIGRPEPRPGSPLGTTTRSASLHPRRMTLRPVM